MLPRGQWARAKKSTKAKRGISSAAASSRESNAQEGVRLGRLVAEVQARLVFNDELCFDLPSLFKVTQLERGVVDKQEIAALKSAMHKAEAGWKKRRP